MLRIIIAGILTSILPPQTSTIDAIARAALVESFHSPNGDKWEYGGIIAEYNGKYYASAPRTIQSPIGLEYKVRDLLPEGYKLAGSYHTHPCIFGYDQTHFSEKDVISTSQDQQPAFILDQCTGIVYRLNPSMIVDAHGRTVVQKTMGFEIAQIGENTMMQLLPNT